VTQKVLKEKPVMSFLPEPSRSSPNVRLHVPRACLDKMEHGELRVELVVSEREALQEELDRQGSLESRGTLVRQGKLEGKDPREPQA